MDAQAHTGSGCVAAPQTDIAWGRTSSCRLGLRDYRDHGHRPDLDRRVLDDVALAQLSSHDCVEQRPSVNVNERPVTELVHHVQDRRASGALNAFDCAAHYTPPSVIGNTRSLVRRTPPVRRRTFDRSRCSPGAAASLHRGRFPLCCRRSATSGTRWSRRSTPRHSDAHTPGRRELVTYKFCLSDGSGGPRNYVHSTPQRRVSLVPVASCRGSFDSTRRRLAPRRDRQMMDAHVGFARPMQSATLRPESRHRGCRIAFWRGTGVVRLPVDRDDRCGDAPRDPRFRVVFRSLGPSVQGEERRMRESRFTEAVVVRKSTSGGAAEPGRTAESSGFLENSAPCPPRGAYLLLQSACID